MLGRTLFVSIVDGGRFVRAEFFKDRTLIKPKNDGSRRVRLLITNKRLISKLNLGFRLKYLTTNLPGIEPRLTNQETKHQLKCHLELFNEPNLYALLSFRANLKI